MKSTLLVFCCVFIVLCSATKHTKRDAAYTIKGRSTIVDELHDAIDHNDMRKVQSLIDTGAPLNCEKCHPLHNSIRLYRLNGFNERIFRLLIRSEADLEKVDSDGATPLYLAADCGNTKAAKILLENRANPNAYNKLTEKSVLQAAFDHSATISSEEGLIELLIQYGADVNQTDSNGVTPLHTAIFRGHKKSIEMLIENGANVKCHDKWNMTPLHYIAIMDFTKGANDDWTEEDSLKFAEMLINHGADVYAKGFYEGGDKTALDLATSTKLRKFLGSKMGFMGWIRTIW